MDRSKQIKVMICTIRELHKDNIISDHQAKSIIESCTHQDKPLSTMIAGLPEVARSLAINVLPVLEEVCEDRIY